MYNRNQRPTIGNKIGQFWDNTVDVVRKNVPKIVGGVVAVAGLAAPLVVGSVTADPSIDLAKQIGDAYTTGYGIASTAVGAVSGLLTTVPSAAKAVGGAIDKAGEWVSETTVGKAVGAFYNNTLDIFKDEHGTRNGPAVTAFLVTPISLAAPFLYGIGAAIISDANDLERQINESCSSVGGIAVMATGLATAAFTVAGYSLAQHREEKRNAKRIREINRKNARRESSGNNNPFIRLG